LVKITEHVQICRRFRTYVNDPHRPALSLLRESDETGGGLYDARSSNTHKYCAAPESLHHRFHVVRRLAKPANVGPDTPAALAVGQVISGVFVYIIKWSTPAASPLTATLKQLAVHVHYMDRACLLVQCVDILCADKKSLSQLLFKIC
jgi:hypothetical protein